MTDKTVGTDTQRERDEERGHHWGFAPVKPGVAGPSQAGHRRRRAVGLARGRRRRTEVRVERWTLARPTDAVEKRVVVVVKTEDVPVTVVRVRFH